MRLNLSNNGSAVLQSDISGNDTNITVDSTEALPEVPFPLTLNMTEEIVYVTAVDGNKLTVERGREGTESKAYPSGTECWVNFTVGAYDGLSDSIDEVGGELTSHKAESVHQGEVHGFRLTDGKLEYFDGTEWQRVKGDGYPVGNVADFTAQARNGEVTLTWKDPDDVTITDSNGNIITIARWAGTKLLRKEGSYPVDGNDGTLVVDNTTRNQYESNGFIDTGLTNGTTYYYMLFPYTEDTVTIDGANRVTAKPIEYTFEDTSNSPGPKYVLIGKGDSQAGFFGEVPASEIFTASEIAISCGISAGIPQNENESWLKFVLDGKILFKPKKSLRYEITWDDLKRANCVNGNKTISKNGLRYKVRLIKGAIKDPVDIASSSDMQGSEWNRLMLPIHEQAIDKSWEYPRYVESNVPTWRHNFGSGQEGMYTDMDFSLTSGQSGSLVMCQETIEGDSGRALGRGRYGVCYANTHSKTSLSSHIRVGWSPVLELVE